MTLIRTPNHVVRSPNPAPHRYRLALRVQPSNHGVDVTSTSCPDTQPWLSREIDLNGIAGAKRTRSEEPADLSDYYSSSDSEDDSDLESDDEYCPPETDLDEEFDTDVKAQLQNLLVGLVICAKLCISSFLASATYIAPSMEEVPFNKYRPRARKRLCSIHCGKEDESNFQDGTSFQLDGFFHLACPFYKLNPKKYQSCLKNHHLESIEDLRGHVWQAHKQPAYCPICYAIFDTPKQRDEHARSKTCERLSPRVIDGITMVQKERIKKRDRYYLPEWKRWMRIWDVLFPYAERPESPFLQDGLEQKVCMVRDFWADKGVELIEKYLSDRNNPSDGLLKREGVVSALDQMVLNSVLNDILTEKACDEELSRTETTNIKGV